MANWYPESFCAGRKVADVAFHQSTSIVSIKRGETLLIPGSKTVFLPDDQVTVFCRKTHGDEVRKMFAAPQTPSR